MRDAMQEPVKLDPVEPDEGVAPGWSPDGDDEPPGGAAPV
jgi:hypothetical protein